MRVGWPFPRPPWPLSRCRAGLRGPRSRVSTRRRVYRALLGFTPPSELLLHADRFAVAETPGRPASLGIRPYTPPPTYRGCVHSHRCRHRLRSRGATRATCSVLVVSHHLDGLLRNRDRELVASRSRSWGSPRFRPPPPPHDRGRETDEAEDFPATQYPSKNPPRQQPYRVTTAFAFLPSSPGDRRALRSAEADPHTLRSTPPVHRCTGGASPGEPAPRPCSTDESVTSDAVADLGRPILPGLCPPSRYPRHRTAPHPPRKRDEHPLARAGDGIPPAVRRKGPAPEGVGPDRRRRSLSGDEVDELRGAPGVLPPPSHRGETRRPSWGS